MPSVLGENISRFNAKEHRIPEHLEFARLENAKSLPSRSRNDSLVSTVSHTSERLRALVEALQIRSGISSILSRLETSSSGVADGKAYSCAEVEMLAA